MTDTLTRPTPDLDVAPEPPSPEQRRRTTLIFALFTLTTLLGCASLAWFGYKSSLDLTGGASLKVVSDPEAPGYEAEVKPTPTLLVTLSTPVDDYRMAFLLARNPFQGGGASALAIPSAFIGTGTDVKLPETLYKEGGLDALVSPMEESLGCAIGGSVNLQPVDIVSLVANLGTIEVPNADEVVVDGYGIKKVMYPVGTLSLNPTEFADFLAFEGTGEVPFNRAARIQSAWEAWYRALSAKGEAGLPTQPTAAAEQLLPFLKAAARTDGASAVDTVPLEAFPIPLPEGGVTAGQRIDREANDRLLAKYVPFPSSAFGGQRFTAKLLNGSRTPDAELFFAEKIVAVGGEVRVLGNAPKLGVATSSVQYFSDDIADEANSLAAELGVTVEQTSSPAAANELVVVIGEDRAGGA